MKHGQDIMKHILNVEILIWAQPPDPQRCSLNEHTTGKKNSAVMVARILTVSRKCIAKVTRDGKMFMTDRLRPACLAYWSHGQAIGITKNSDKNPQIFTGELEQFEEIGLGKGDSKKRHSFRECSWWLFDRNKKNETEIPQSPRKNKMAFAQTKTAEKNACTL